MKRIRKIIAALCLLLVLATTLPGLENTESVHPKSIRNQMIQTLVETGHEEKKIKALDWVNRMIAEDSVDKNDEELMTILYDLATEPYLKPEKQGIGPVIVNDHYFARLKTVKILGKIGGPYSIDALCTVLKYEEKTDLLINTMYSIAMIGENPDNQVTDTIYESIFRLSHLNCITDEFAYSTLLALESINDKGNNIACSDIYWVLQDLNNDKYCNMVQSLCLKVMDKIWSAN